MSMDFVSYALFVFMGCVLGAVLGRHAMRWYWGAATTSQKNEIGYWIALFLACTYLGARRFW